MLAVAGRSAFSTMRDQPRTAIDAEYASLASCCRMLCVAALSRADALVDDATTHRAMADGGLRPSMIQVVARIALLELSHHRATPFPCVRLRLSPRTLRFRFRPALAHRIPEARAGCRAAVRQIAFPLRGQETQQAAYLAVSLPEPPKRLT
jgi:hypothetical protein